MEGDQWTISDQLPAIIFCSTVSKLSPYSIQRGDGPLTKSLPNYSCHNDAIYLFTNCTDTNAFRRIIDGNAESCQPTVMTNVLTNAHSLDNLITT